MASAWIRTRLTVGLGLGLLVGMTTPASAQYLFRPREANCPCPPGQVAPGPYAPLAPFRTTDPSRMTDPARPNDPSRPSDPMSPSSNDPNRTTQSQNDPNAANSNQNQNQNANQNQNSAAQNSPSTDFNQAATASTGDAGPMSSGSSTPFAGRLDMNNRFNLFDNMSAFPQNRAWFGYQLATSQNTGISLSPNAQLASRRGTLLTPNGIDFENLSEVIRRTEGISGDIIRKSKQNGYRFGLETKLSDYVSLAMQGTYFQPFSTDDPVEDFGNPQFLLKSVLVTSDTFVMSGTLGFSPEISHEKAVLNDNDTYILPGMLAYVQITPDLFFQGAAQFSYPVNNAVRSFDWGASFGYWLYRNETLHPNLFVRRERGGSYLHGIVPQIEFFGKHVIGNNQLNGQFHLSPFAPQSASGQPLYIDDGFTATRFNQPIFVYEEPKDVIDMTVATQFLLCGGVTITTGYSFPLSSDSVRKSEFLTTINFNF